MTAGMPSNHRLFILKEARRSVGAMTEDEKAIRDLIERQFGSLFSR